MIDVLVIYRGRKVDRVLRIGENGEVEEVRHLPWFVALRPMPTRGIVEIEEVPLKFYVFNPSTWRYEKASDRSYVVYTETPSLVRWISARYEDNEIPCALNNIRYKARVSMDLADRLFGVKVPLILYYSLDELESAFRDIYEKASCIKVMGFDIEVRAEGSFPRMGEKVFIVSACWGELGSDEEECVVLEMDDVHDFGKIVEKVRPNYLCGFVSENFDIPYLTAYVTDIPLSREGYITGSIAIPHIDVAMILDQHALSFGLPLGARLALDDIAKKMGLIKEEKELEIESSIDRNRIWLEYQRNRDKVIKYAEVDSRLTLRVSKEVLKVLIGVYALTGISPSTVQRLPSFGSIAEYAVLDAVRRKFGKVYQVRSTKYTAKEIVDALAFYRKGTKEHFISPGLWRNVGYYDFNMLYPTVYYKFKLDPEGVRIGSGFRVYLVEKKKKRNDKYVYMKDVKHVVDVSFCGGDVYEVLKYFYEGRKVTKAMKKELPAVDQAMKILANSAYGMFSKGRGGGVNEVLSGFIFFKSSDIFMKALGIVKNMLNRRYVYGATDSFFILLEENDDPARMEERINEYVKKWFGSEFSVKFEGVCKYFALLARKTYICVMDDETLVKGMEKLEIPVVIKDNLDEIFRRVLEGEDWRAVLEELYNKASIPEMFVKTSKSIEDLYNEEERRFKELNSNRTKAVAIKYLVDEGQRIDGKGYLSLYLSLENLPNTTVIAYFLKSNRSISGKQAIHVLIDYSEDKAMTYECALLDSEIGNYELAAEFYCFERELSKEEIEELSKRQAKRVIEYLKTIERMMKQRKLI